MAGHCSGCAQIDEHALLRFGQLPARLLEFELEELAVFDGAHVGHARHNTQARHDRGLGLSTETAVWCVPGDDTRGRAHSEMLEDSFLDLLFGHAASPCNSVSSSHASCTLGHEP